MFKLRTLVLIALVYSLGRKIGEGKTLVYIGKDKDLYNEANIGILVKEKSDFPLTFRWSGKQK